MFLICLFYEFKMIGIVSNILFNNGIVIGNFVFIVCGSLVFKYVLLILLIRNVFVLFGNDSILCM